MNVEMLNHMNEVLYKPLLLFLPKKPIRLFILYQ